MTTTNRPTSSASVVLVLGLTYRERVKELAYSRALPLIDRLAFRGARVSAWDPLLSAGKVERCGAAPWAWGMPSDVRAIVVQAADPEALARARTETLDLQPAGAARRIVEALGPTV